MIERSTGLTLLAHTLIWLMLAIILFPLYLALVAATLDDNQITRLPLPLIPGHHLWANISHVWHYGVNNHSLPLWQLLLNSLLMALGITVGKLAISILSAFALVWFRFPLRQFFFWLIFITLMLPVEVRIFPTVEVITRLHLVDSYSGLILPMTASATATFLFRQFFMSLPNELVEAARVDGAGAMRFFIDIVLPLSRSTMAALFVITFIYGWNQYLWPIIINTDPRLDTAVAGIRSMISHGEGVTQWNRVMSAVLLTLLPPLIVVIALQKFFIKGLVEREK